jgi:acetoin utilization protein AcuB
MIARQLITDGIMPLKTSDTGKTALAWMEEYKVSHLPIVNNQKLLGLISELDIYDLNRFDEALGNHKLHLIHPYVDEDQHIYDVIKLVYEQDLTVIPVLNQHEDYLGCISIQNLIKYFAKSLSIDNPGGIIVLEMTYNNYSLTEIAKIVEENDAKILSTFIVNHENSTRMDVFLKINKLEMDAILRTFERYEYFVKGSYHENSDTDDIQDRYNSLMNYLNV